MNSIEFLELLNSSKNKLSDNQNVFRLTANFSVVEKQKLFIFLEKYQYLKKDLKGNLYSFEDPETLFFSFGSNLLLFNETTNITKLFFIYGVSQGDVCTNAYEYFIHLSGVFGKYDEHLYDEDIYEIIKCCIQNDMNAIINSQFSDYFYADINKLLEINLDAEDMLRNTEYLNDR